MTTSPGQRLMPPTASLPGPTRGELPRKVSAPGRRPAGAALAVVVLILLGSTIAYYLWSTAGAKVPVVVAADDIPLGHVITRQDLTTTDLAGSLTAVGANHLESLVGQTASVGIVAGTPLQRAMVQQGSPVPAGQTVVGVAVSGSEVPSLGLQPGDKVEVLGLPAKDAPSTTAATGPTVLSPLATVLDMRADPSTQGGFLLSLQAPSGAAAAIAAASNAGLVALLHPGGQG